MNQKRPICELVKENVEVVDPVEVGNVDSFAIFDKEFVYCYKIQASSWPI